MMEIVEKYPDVAKHLFGVLVSRLDNANKVTVKLANDMMKK